MIAAGWSLRRLFGYLGCSKATSQSAQCKLANLRSLLVSDYYFYQRKTQHSLRQVAFNTVLQIVWQYWLMNKYSTLLLLIPTMCLFCHSWDGIQLHWLTTLSCCLIYPIYFTWSMHYVTMTYAFSIWYFTKGLFFIHDPSRFSQ